MSTATEHRPAGTPVMLPPGGGREITGVGGRLLVAHGHPAFASAFEMRIPPGFDVGAHVHNDAEEVFFVLEGELDVLCFEPVDRSVADWHDWRTESGDSYLRGGPGAFMYVPAGYPHAFGNPTDSPVRMFFQSTVAGGHENYFDEMAEILRTAEGNPDPGAIAELRRRYDIDQLTTMNPGTTVQ